MKQEFKINGCGHMNYLVFHKITYDISYLLTKFIQLLNSSAILNSNEIAKQSSFLILFEYNIEYFLILY